MPGVFSKNARPKLPGAYFNFEASERTTVQPSTGSTVAIPLTHDWGPFETPTTVTSLAEWHGLFGPSTDTPGYKAVKQCFQGEDVGDASGAGAIIVYRAGAAAAAKATKSLNNTTPAAALTLTARYEGSYGNNLSVTIQDNAANAANDDLIVLLNGIEVERYTYANTNITALVDAINDDTTGSDWITATQVITGVALTYVSNSAFASGADGETLVAGDWTAARTALEPHRFSIFAPYDLTDGAIITSTQVWAATLNRAGKRFISVFGGALDETVSTANTRTLLLNDNITIDGQDVYPGHDFINLGVGGVEDDELGTLSTSQLAPRIAGILAQRGEDQSLTFARLGGVTARNFGTEANFITAYDAGTTVLALDSNPDAPVHILKGLTTYVGGDAAKPYTIYRNPKFVRTMHGIETEASEYAANFIVGKATVSDLGRAAVIGHAKALIKTREDRGVLQPGSVVYADPEPAPTEEDEFIAVVYGITFGRSVEQVFNTARIA